MVRETPISTESLRDAILEGMASHAIPGAVVGLHHAGLETIVPAGVTSVRYPLPVGEETYFQVGSITKTVTGTAIMRLADEGRIDLDAPVRAYLPSFRVADEETAKGVTVCHLLTHTAGWAGDFWADTGRGDDALARTVDLMADRPQLAPIGQVWAYNNAAFYVAGRIIEVVTGETYEAAARRLVLAPLGMPHSHYLPEEVMTYSFAVGHEVTEGVATPVPRWQFPRSGGPIGRLISTAGDLLRYARFHMGDGRAEDGTRILRPETVALMQTPLVPAAGGESLGLTWFIKDVGGLKTVSHGGATGGQTSILLMVPEREFALVVLTNADRGPLLYEDLVARALCDYLGVEQKEPQPRAPAVEEMTVYTGRYEGAEAYVDLTLHGNDLLLRHVPTRGMLLGDEPAPPSPPCRVTLLEGDRLRMEDGPLEGATGEFLRSEDGEILWLRLSLRLYRRQEQEDSA